LAHYMYGDYMEEPRYRFEMKPTMIIRKIKVDGLNSEEVFNHKCAESPFALVCVAGSVTYEKWDLKEKN